MITAIDTNVLIDVLAADPQFGKLSAQALRASLQGGAVVACPVVWTETATAFRQESDFLTNMATLGIEYSEIEQAATLLAASAWRRYRKQGGPRQRVVADFLVGAHARTHCDQLSTRDRGTYKKYFDKLEVIDPTQ